MNEAFIQQSSTGLWLSFDTPFRVIEAWIPGEILPALQEVERLVEENTWYAVGFVTYEAAPEFDRAFRTRVCDVISEQSLPLLRFALYAAPEILPASQLFPVTRNDEAVPVTALNAWLPSVDHVAYCAAIDTIHGHIARGDTYQVNYTWRLRGQLAGDARHWFGEMVRVQSARHGAYLDIGQFVVLSASPELFFSLDGRRLITRPMKGTAARAPDLATDQARASALRTSAKERAENVMIVDMMRNDLSRIADLGSVQVARLFAIEQYATVWQMTSTVEALTDHSVTEIFRALFPAASVTGAPKVYTMGLIADLETTPRGLYTGAIGFIAPGRRAEFNVAIRTVVLNRASGVAEYGVGGGIVWDSETTSEYAECLTKAQVLWVRRPRFSLLETLLWTPTDGFSLLEEHLARISGSASYFGYPIDLEGMRRILTESAAGFSPSPQRVRLLLDEDGTMRTESIVLDPCLAQVSLVLATTAINSSDPFFYHKTTHRAGYERARRECPGGEDVLLWNERGEITETTIANVVVDLDGEWVTPPITAGLLAGTYRRKLLEEGTIREKTIKLTDLTRANGLWVINSVRGQRRASLDGYLGQLLFS
ncbi:para-aminobenzoate synthetase / 4-amino-4-deoxychorismate lyase [Gammaproteobacteria bacterium]